MVISSATLPAPPRLIGVPNVDNAAIVDWAWNVYRVVVIEQQIPDRLNAIASLPIISTVISASPTQAQVEELKSKINAIISASAPQTT